MARVVLVMVLSLAAWAAGICDAWAYGEITGQTISHDCYSATTWVGPGQGSNSGRCYRSLDEAAAVDGPVVAANYKWQYGRYSVTNTEFYTHPEGGYVDYRLCVVWDQGGGCQDWWQYVGYRVYKESEILCSGNSMAVDGKCVCKGGYAPDSSGQCKPSVCPAAGTSVGNPDKPATFKGKAASSQLCVSGCVVQGSEGGFYPDKGQGYVWGPFVATGQTCNPNGQGGSLPSAGTDSPGATMQTDSLACPKGQVYGTVNDTPVCVKSSSATVGSVSSPSASSPATVTQTDCSGGVCSTKTGTIDPNGVVSWSSSTVTNDKAVNANAGSGSGSSSSGDTQDQKSFCQENPGLSICKNSSFGGTCGGFTCDGDAIQCAMAREQYTRNCQLFNADDPLVKAGQAAFDGAGAGASAPGVGSSVSLAFGDRIDTTDAIGAACPGDRSVSLSGGYSFVMPFSRICQEAAVIRLALLAVCWLVCVRIVFGGA